MKTYFCRKAGSFGESTWHMVEAEGFSQAADDFVWAQTTDGTHTVEVRYAEERFTFSVKARLVRKVKSARWLRQ